MIFGSKFMGFDGESMRNMIGRRVFSSELFFVDLGRLVRFLIKWRLDLGSLDRLESTGMFEIFGH